MIPLYQVFKIVKFIESKSRMVVARDWRGGGNGEILIDGHKVLLKREE